MVINDVDFVRIGRLMADADASVEWFLNDFNEAMRDPEYAREKIRAAMKALKRADDMLKPVSTSNDAA